MKRRSLAYLLEFSKEDIEANREGYMTKEQRRFHRANGREIAGLKGLATGTILGVLFGTMIGNAIGTIALNWFFPSVQPRAQVLNTITNVAGILTCLVVSYVTGKHFYQPYQRDLYKGNVEAVSGHIHLRRLRRDSGGPAYRISI
jgi:hypothetical protein